jgi:hypothetical protein
VRAQVLPVELGEACGRGFLPAEELDHAHARQPLLQERVQPRQPVPDVPERVAHPPAEDRGREPHQRDDGERDQRQLDVEDEHHPHDGQQGEDVPEDGDHAGGEQLVQRLHVGRDPGHQPADRIAVEVGDAEALEMPEDLHAQVVHHPLPHEGRQQHPGVLHHQLQQQGRQVQPGKEAEQPHVLARNGDVEGTLGQSRSHQRDPRLQQEQEHRARGQPAVGPEIAQQSPEQRGVIPRRGEILIVRHRAYPLAGSASAF